MTLPYLTAEFLVDAASRTAESVGPPKRCDLATAAKEDRNVENQLCRRYQAVVP